MAVDTMDKVSAGLAGTVQKQILKIGPTNQSTGTHTSYWRSTGYPPAGTIPTTAVTPTDDTPGSWQLPTPAGGNKLHVGLFTPSGSTLGSIMLVDRLAHMGGLSGIVVSPTTQAVNLSIADAAAAGRCASDGSDVLWFAEWYADTGGTQRSLTATYVDQAGDTQTAQVITAPTTTRASRMFPVVPTAAVGGYIKSITSCVWDASTGAAGNFGFTAIKFLVNVPVNIVGAGEIIDFAKAGLVEVPPTACLAIMTLNGSSGSPTITGIFKIIEG